MKLNQSALNYEKRSDGTLEAKHRRRRDERRGRENRGAVGAEGGENGEGMPPPIPTTRVWEHLQFPHGLNANSFDGYIIYIWLYGYIYI